jgi:uncharacterized protein (TIGR00645 family)
MSKVVSDPVREKIEHALEIMLFSGRWLLAPLYLGLIATLFALIIKFGIELVHMFSHLFVEDFHLVSLRILGLLDITLLGNLILIMIFAGYENFVSKIAVAADSEDRPQWMGKVDYSGLKIKLIGSLVALSVIELLKDFMQAGEYQDYEAVKWRIAIHLTFVISGVLFAVMDYIADKRHVEDMHEPKKPAARKKSA